MNRRPDLGALIEASRATIAPSTEDRERNRAKIAGRIGAGIVVGSAIALHARNAAGYSGAHASITAATTAVKASGTVAATVAKWIAVSVLVTAGSVAGLHAVRSHAADPSAAAPTASAQASLLAPPVPTSEIAPPPALTETVTTRADVPSSRARGPKTSAPTTSRAEERLGRELELLRSARRALDSGTPAAALDLLDRYAAEFPHGSALQPEYDATRVLALCAAGHTSAGERERDRFLDRQPGSPLADRVRKACGGR